MDRETPIAADVISGAVSSAHGPEAGVWVIAQTDDLPTRYVKIVVTDARGRFVLPDLPRAHYQLWVRGYGLVDSKPLDAVPGRRVALTAVPAQDDAAAAHYYPSNYWQAMMPAPTAPQSWLATLKSCMICHQTATPVMRNPADKSAQAWKARMHKARPPGDAAMGILGSGYAAVMSATMQQLGEEGPAAFSSWSQRIADGALPAPPPRPTGIERNVVLTLWGWGDRSFVHDLAAADPLAVTTGANGPIYATEPNIGRFVQLDPRKNAASSMEIPEGLTHPMMVTMDRKARIWFPTYGKAFLKANFADDLPPKPECPDEWREDSRAGFPSSPRIEHMRLYDPKTRKLTTLPVCLNRNGRVPGNDADTLFFTSDSVLTWIDTASWDRTHDPVRSEGWCPVILNTTGRDPDRRFGLTDGTLATSQWNVLGKSADSRRDTRIVGSFVFRARRNPNDGSIWITAYRGVPGGIIRIERGANPPYSCTSEYFEPPKIPGTQRFMGYGPMNIDFDRQGKVWVALLSGNLASFDPRLCPVRRGPTATGQQCPQGWQFHALPGPRFAGTDEPADFEYGLLVDKNNTFGSGNDTVLLGNGNSDSLVMMQGAGSPPALIRVPYPMGFYARELSGRIDNPRQGWKGRGVWGGYNTIPVWHQEGDAAHPMGVVRFQFRPDPLAH